MANDPITIRQLKTGFLVSAGPEQGELAALTAFQDLVGWLARRFEEAQPAQEQRVAQETLVERDRRQPPDAAADARVDGDDQPPKPRPATPAADETAAAEPAAAAARDIVDVIADLTPNQERIYDCLALKMMSAKDWFRMTRGQIADGAGVHEGAVPSAIQALKARGLIEVDNRGTGHPVRYRVTLDAADDGEESA